MSEYNQSAPDTQEPFLRLFANMFAIGFYKFFTKFQCIFFSSEITRLSVWFVDLAAKNVKNFFSCYSTIHPNVKTFWELLHDLILAVDELNIATNALHVNTKAACGKTIFALHVSHETGHTNCSAYFAYASRNA